jgi:hypothetical protein
MLIEVGVTFKAVCSKVIDMLDRLSVKINDDEYVSVGSMFKTKTHGDNVAFFVEEITKIATSRTGSRSGTHAVRCKVTVLGEMPDDIYTKLRVDPMSLLSSSIRRYPEIEEVFLLPNSSHKLKLITDEADLAMFALARL